MNGSSRHCLLGHIPSLINRPLDLLDECERPYVKLNLGRPAWLLLEPADIAHVLRSDAYSKGRAFAFGRRLYGNSLLVSEGADHRRQAREVAGPFFRHAASAFLEPAAVMAEQLSSRWQEGNRIDLWSAMNDLTFAISSSAMFGNDWLPSWLAEGSEDSDQLRQAFDDAMDHVARQNFSLLPLPDWIPIPAIRRYRSAIRTLNRAVHFSIDKRLKSGACGGFLDHLIDGFKANCKSLESVNPIRDQALVLTLGGYESTATALCWSLLLISRHENVRRQLQQEVDQIVGARLPTPDDARQLIYTSRVVSESLRLYPPPWLIPRTAIKAEVLPSGIQFGRGAQVFLSPYRTQRDGEFFPEPKRFSPERFDGKPTWPDASYFPFGLGSRHCIGESIARTQMTLVLAVLCKRWKFEYEGEALPEPIPLLTLRPPTPLWVRVRL